jgi:hypothetical protein
LAPFFPRPIIKAVVKIIWTLVAITSLQTDNFCPTVVADSNILFGSFKINLPVTAGLTVDLTTFAAVVSSCHCTESLLAATMHAFIGL